MGIVLTHSLCRPKVDNILHKYILHIRLYSLQIFFLLDLIHQDLSYRTFPVFIHKYFSHQTLFFINTFHIRPFCIIILDLYIVPLFSMQTGSCAVLLTVYFNASHSAPVPLALKLYFKRNCKWPWKIKAIVKHFAQTDSFNEIANYEVGSRHSLIFCLHITLIKPFEMTPVQDQWMWPWPKLFS